MFALPVAGTMIERQLRLKPPKNKSAWLSYPG
jgi:hypothetical protein